MYSGELFAVGVREGQGFRSSWQILLKGAWWLLAFLIFIDM